VITTRKTCPPYRGRTNDPRSNSGRIENFRNRVHFIPRFIPTQKYHSWLARGGAPETLWYPGRLTDDLDVDIEDHKFSLSENQEIALFSAICPQYSSEGDSAISFSWNNPFQRQTRFRNWLIFSLLRTMGLSQSRIPSLRVEDIDFERHTLAIVPYRWDEQGYPFRRAGAPERHVPLPTMLAFDLERYLSRTDEHGRVSPPSNPYAQRGEYPTPEIPAFLFTTGSGRNMTYGGIYQLLRTAGERILGREVSDLCLRDSWRAEMHHILQWEHPQLYCRGGVE